MVMQEDWDSDEDEGQREVPELRHKPLLKGCPQGVPTSHGGVEGNWRPLVSVLKIIRGWIVDIKD